jgi:CBS domain-containing protein
MNVSDIMTTNVACCTWDTPIKEVAQMMKDCNCGMVPIVEDFESMRLSGVVTDRDICIRAVANGMDPQSTAAGHCMTPAPARVGPQDSLDQVEEIMTSCQVRRVPVVDRNNTIIGIIAQADLAIAAPGHITNVVRQVSKPDKRAA